MYMNFLIHRAVIKSVFLNNLSKTLFYNKEYRNLSYSLYERVYYYYFNEKERS